MFKWRVYFLLLKKRLWSIFHFFSKKGNLLTSVGWKVYLKLSFLYTLVLFCQDKKHSSPSTPCSIFCLGENPFLPFRQKKKNLLIMHSNKFSFFFGGFSFTLVLLGGNLCWVINWSLTNLHFPFMLIASRGFISKFIMSSHE